MKKIFAILIIGLLALTIGCVSNSEQQADETPGLVIMKNNDLSYYSNSYQTSWGSTYKADSDKSFLVIYFTVENLGCGEVSVSPSIFTVTVDNVEYTAQGYIGDKEFPSVKLQKGGKTEGYVCFKVPRRDKISYDIGYRYIYGCKAIIRRA